MRAPRIAFAIVLPVLSSLGPVLGVGNAAALPRAHGAAPDSPKFYFPRRIKRQLGSSSPFLNITNLNAKPNAPKSGQPGSKHDKLDRLLSDLNGGDNEPGATTWTKTVDKVKTNTLSTPTVTQNPRPNIPVQNVPNELRPSSNDDGTDTELLGITNDVTPPAKSASKSASSSSQLPRPTPDRSDNSNFIDPLLQPTPVNNDRSSDGMLISMPKQAGKGGTPKAGTGGSFDGSPTTTQGRGPPSNLLLPSGNPSAGNQPPPSSETNKLPPSPTPVDENGSNQDPLDDNGPDGIGNGSSSVPNNPSSPTPVNGKFPVQPSRSGSNFAVKTPTSDSGNGSTTTPYPVLVNIGSTQPSTLVGQSSKPSPSGKGSTTTPYPVLANTGSTEPPTQVGQSSEPSPSGTAYPSIPPTSSPLGGLDQGTSTGPTTTWPTPSNPSDKPGTPKTYTQIDQPSRTDSKVPPSLLGLTSRPHLYKPSSRLPFPASDTTVPGYADHGPGSGSVAPPTPTSKIPPPVPNRKPPIIPPSSGVNPNAIWFQTSALVVAPPVVTPVTTHGYRSTVVVGVPPVKPTEVPLDPKLPKVITPVSGMPAAPRDMILVRLGFTHPLNYQWVVGEPIAVAQIFEYVPQGLNWGLQCTDVRMHSLQPYDTRKNKGYITTLALAFIPKDLFDQLDLQRRTPSSRLLNNPEKAVRDIMNLLDPSIPLRASLQEESGLADGKIQDDHPSYGSSGDGGTANAGNSGGSPINNKSGPITTKSIGIGTGVVVGALAYGGAMFLIARRYRQRRNKHTRASSLSGAESPASFPTGQLMAANPMAAGGARMHGARGAYEPVDRGSKGSGGRGSARGANISAPLMAANSLGWN